MVLYVGGSSQSWISLLVLIHIGYIDHMVKLAHVCGGNVQLIQLVVCIVVLASYSESPSMSVSANEFDNIARIYIYMYMVHHVESCGKCVIQLTRFVVVL